MAPRAVLLDLGNVLVLHDNEVLMRRLAARGGMSAEALAARFPPDLWDRLNRGALGTPGLQAALSEALGTELGEGEFRELWSCHFTIHQAVLPLVEGLVGRTKLVLVSNTNEAHINWVKPRLPLLQRFDALVLSYELGLAKPDPAIFREALRRAGVAPDEAAFFDDIDAYVEAASALGIAGRVFTTADAFQRQLAALGL